MDDSNLSSYDDFWDALMPNGSSTSPSGNFDTSWDSLLPSNNNNSASVRDRPDFSFSFSPLASSPHNNHHRTSQHRRRNHRSPVNPQNSNSLSSNQPNRTNHEPLPPLSLDSYNPQLPDTAAFEQYPQSQPGQQSRTDQHIQLPGINTTFPDFNFNDRPTSRFSWDSTGGDSLFADGDFWPDFDDSNINYSLDNDGFVDLTADPSPLHAMGPVTRKRRASATPLPAPSSLPSCSAKRRKTNEGAAVKIEEAKVEQLDLLDVDDDSGLSQVLEQQQVAAIKEQQEPQGDQPIRLSSLQCIICLEPMKDMTVTHCGHLFCHTCIMEALIAGENQSEPGKPTSKCPLCRKKVSRPKEKSRDKREVVPLEIKLSTRSSIAKGKAKA